MKKTLDKFELTKQEEFSNILFKNSDFTSKELNAIEFTDCTFENCDFSMTQLNNVVLTRIKFDNCKLLGIDFSKCSKFAFSVNFTNCILNYSHFNKNNLGKVNFTNCQIKEANFFDTDLSKANFNNSDLQNTIFERCQLVNADFRNARNYIINPTENNIKKARFDFPGVLGLLQHFDIVIE